MKRDALSLEPRNTGVRARVLVGDVLEMLRTLPDESVNCVVTSPPYYGLRDYGVAGQIGLEKSLPEYLAVMVTVFRECRRVLRRDGTCWVNIGDSYNGSTQGGGNGKRCDGGTRRLDLQRVTQGHVSIKERGLKPKDLCGVPWRLAFALQEDGWYLRQDIIWSKPNPMPESVTDRCTKAHEYIFLLSKSERYAYDAKAIAEPVTQSTVARLAQVTLADQTGSSRVPGKTNGNMKAVAPRFGGSKYGDDPSVLHQTKSGNPYAIKDGLRNKRTVWEMATQPFAEAHFATFPEELPRTCILAGCPEGGTVLDPFAGSGTTLAVALSLGRQSIGIELNPEYAKLIHKRLAGVTPPLFSEVQPPSSVVPTERMEAPALFGDEL